MLDPGRQDLQHKETRYLFIHYNNFNQLSFYHSILNTHTQFLQIQCTKSQNICSVHTRIQPRLKEERVPRCNLTVSPHDWFYRTTTNAQASYDVYSSVPRRTLNALRRKSSQPRISNPPREFRSPPTPVLRFWKSSEALSQKWLSSLAWWRGVRSPTLSKSRIPAAPGVPLTHTPVRSVEQTVALRTRERQLEKTVKMVKMVSLKQY